MSGKAKRGRPRLPGKRVGILLRIDPELAAWYRGAAKRAGRSRTQFLRMVLAQVRLVAMRLDATDKRVGLAPWEVADAAGGEFLTMLAELGLADGLVKDALQERAAAHRREVAERRQVQEDGE